MRKPGSNFLFTIVGLIIQIVICLFLKFTLEFYVIIFLLDHHNNIPKVYKICKFENDATRNDIIMMSLPKIMENNGKMWISSKLNKMYIVRKVLMRAIQKCNFYLI